MTDEARGYNSEDAPARPASTRWSEDPVQDDDGLAPPYVPGRRTQAATSEEEDFPFDQFDGEGETAGDTDTAAPEAGVGEEATVVDEAGVAEDVGSETGARVWSPEDLEDDDEPVGRAEPEHGEGSYEEGSYGEETFGEWPPGYEDDDASAVDAELEPITDEAPIEEAEAAEVGPEHRFEPDGSIESAPSDERVEEVAAVLDRLAGLLREEGEEAVRREMESPDRLTALMSSLLSGHLSARQ